MSKKKLKGSITALVTPFDKNLKIDLKTFKRLLKMQAQGGSDGVLVGGTTGEGSTLSVKEKLLLLDAAASTVGQDLTVVASCGDNDTKKAANLAQTLSSSGADYLLAITPFYNKCNEEGMYRHFCSIADKSAKPIIIYNVPSRTGCGVNTETLRRLKTHGNIVGIKQADADMDVFVSTSLLCDDNFKLFCGNDNLIAPCMAAGAAGVISVAANLTPSVVKKIVDAYDGGNAAECTELFKKYYPLFKALFCDVNPIPIKYALKTLGVPSCFLRLPLCFPSEKNAKTIEQILTAYDARLSYE